MNGASLAKLHNGVCIAESEVPEWDFGRLRRAIVDAVADGARVSALFGNTAGPADAVELCAVLADDSAGLLYAAKTRVNHNDFHSLTPDCPQVHLFEREIAEQFGLRPEGHPWLKPVRFHSSQRLGHDAWERSSTQKPIVGATDFYRMEGEEIHEVAVGPVHAGVIEPGHFRFQCHG